MQIEAGKFYRTRDGRKVGPIEVTRAITNYGQFHDEDRKRFWDEYGRVYGASCEVIGDLIAEWTDEPTEDKPKTWGEMTRLEQGEILVDDHNGEPIEAFVHGDFWEEKKNGFPYFPNKSYRVRKEPVREAVTLSFREANSKPGDWYAPVRPPTHRITFYTIDGKPDCASITMAKLAEVR